MYSENTSKTNMLLAPPEGESRVELEGLSRKHAAIAFIL